MKEIISKEILAAAKNGDFSAQNEIILKLNPLLTRLCSRFFIIGGDKEDLMQEARISLLKAIQNYDDSKESSFIPYATICIHHHIISAINHAQAKKHAVLNQSLNLDDLEQFSYDNPMDLVINREELETVLAVVKVKLSVKERRVLALYLDGMSYKEIAKMLQTSVKSVSNALCRIRSKLS